MSVGALVLVVEDEPLVRTVAVEALQEAGYVTLEAGDAEEAIRLLETQPGIRLLFTDVQMPGSTDGIKLAAAVRKRWPPVRILITSARPKPLMIDDAVFLPKPYDLSALARQVEAILS